MAGQGDKKTAPKSFWDTTADNWNPMIVLEFRKAARNGAVGFALFVAMLVQLLLIFFVFFPGFGNVEGVTLICPPYLSVVGWFAVIIGVKEGRIRFSIKKDNLYDRLGGDMFFRFGYSEYDELLEQNPLTDLQKFHARFIIGLVWSGIVSLLVLPLAVVFDIAVNGAPLATGTILGGIYGVQTLRLLFHSWFPINRKIDEYFFFLYVAGIVGFLTTVVCGFAFEDSTLCTPEAVIYWIVMCIATPIAAYFLVRHHLSAPRKDPAIIAVANFFVYMGMLIISIGFLSVLLP